MMNVFFECEDTHLFSTDAYVANTIKEAIGTLIKELKYFLLPEHHCECDLDDDPDRVVVYETVINLLETKNYEYEYYGDACDVILPLRKELDRIDNQ